jgi:hypothetical protein
MQAASTTEPPARKERLKARRDRRRMPVSFPHCGAEFHFKADEIRNSAPCAKCGENLVMPLGRVSRDHGGVLGQSRGRLTGPELEQVIILQATDAIRRWEEVCASTSSTPEERKAAMLAAYWKLFPRRGKSIVLNGKRYKGISRRTGLEIRVTPVSPKT